MNFRQALPQYQETKDLPSMSARRCAFQLFNPRFIIETAGTRYSSLFPVSRGDEDAKVATAGVADGFAAACGLRRKFQVNLDLAPCAQRAGNFELDHSLSGQRHDRARYNASILRDGELFGWKHQGFDRDSALVLPASRHGNR
jgi:hypothetical protein